MLLHKYIVVPEHHQKLCVHIPKIEGPNVLALALGPHQRSIKKHLEEGLILLEVRAD